MKAWFKKNYKKYMLRPIVQKAVTEFLIALALCLLWGRFMYDPNRPVTGLYTYPTAAVVFAAFAWFSTLRLDNFGRFPKRRKEEPKRTVLRSKSMADYLDEPLHYDEELTDRQKLICRITSRLACCAVFCIMYIILYIANAA